MIRSNRFHYYEVAGDDCPQKKENTFNLVLGRSAFRSGPSFYSYYDYIKAEDICKEKRTRYSTCARVESHMSISGAGNYSIQWDTNKTRTKRGSTKEKIIFIIRKSNHPERPDFICGITCATSNYKIIKRALQQEGVKIKLGKNRCKIYFNPCLNADGHIPISAKDFIRYVARNFYDDNIANDKEALAQYYQDTLSLQHNLSPASVIKIKAHKIKLQKLNGILKKVLILKQNIFLLNKFQNEAEEENFLAKAIYFITAAEKQLNQIENKKFFPLFTKPSTLLKKISLSLRLAERNLHKYYTLYEPKVLHLLEEYLKQNNLPQFYQAKDLAPEKDIARICYQYLGGSQGLFNLNLKDIDKHYSSHQNTNHQ